MFGPENSRRLPLHGSLVPLARTLAAVLLATFTGCAGCKGPLVYDASPETQPGTSPSIPSTSGVTVGLAGSNAFLYAVTANAGVWRSQASSEFASSSSWLQLPNSPPRAFSISVDPNDAEHLAVGERDGD